MRRSLKLYLLVDMLSPASLGALVALWCSFEGCYVEMTPSGVWFYENWVPDVV